MSQIRSEINITPLIDIVLVLLIVFITMVPGMVKAWEVSLPSDRPGGILKDRLPLKVRLDPHDELSLEGQALPLAQLKARIREVWADVKPEQRKAIIRVHPDYPFYRAAEVLDEVKAADPKSSVALLKTDA